MPYDRARAEQLRRAEVTVDAQRPPLPLSTCIRNSHELNQGSTYFICEMCAATIPVPEAGPGVQVVAVE